MLHESLKLAQSSSGERQNLAEMVKHLSEVRFLRSATHCLSVSETHVTAQH